MKSDIFCFGSKLILKNFDLFSDFFLWIGGGGVKIFDQLENADH